MAITGASLSGYSSESSNGVIPDEKRHDRLSSIPQVYACAYIRRKCVHRF